MLGIRYFVFLEMFLAVCWGAVWSFQVSMLGFVRVPGAVPIWGEVASVFPAQGPMNQSGWWRQAVT